MKFMKYNYIYIFEFIHQSNQTIKEKYLNKQMTPISPKNLQNKHNLVPLILNDI